MNEKCVAFLVSMGAIVWMAVILLLLGIAAGR